MPLHPSRHGNRVCTGDLTKTLLEVPFLVSNLEPVSASTDTVTGSPPALTPHNRAKALSDLPWVTTNSREEPGGQEAFLFPKTTVQSLAPEATSYRTDGLAHKLTQLSGVPDFTYQRIPADTARGQFQSFL
ncbi:hypothetical protein MDA_GLEAN10017050 [Myotis davidii]|uniref:Uncharacterized protein n=1 Tax=Myotis davidii TaxID=225400 RepID=L5LF29_MYODS|nr:hypothetical protein MDA_GLEAN10017050 [Myotis davidii]